MYYENLFLITNAKNSSINRGICIIFIDLKFQFMKTDYCKNKSLYLGFFLLLLFVDYEYKILLIDLKLYI